MVLHSARLGKPRWVPLSLCVSVWVGVCVRVPVCGLVCAVVVVCVCVVVVCGCGLASMWVSMFRVT